MFTASRPSSPQLISVRYGSADGTKGCRTQPKISSRRRAFVVIDNRVAPQARTNTSR